MATAFGPHDADGSQPPHEVPQDMPVGHQQLPADSSHDRDPLPPVTTERAEELFRQIADRRFTELTRDTIGTLHPAQWTIPFDFAENGCYNRADQMSAHLHNQGVANKKIWVTHVMAYGPFGFPLLKVKSGNALGALPGQPRELAWTHHVAVVVHVPDGDEGQTKEMVLDPSLHPAGPVTTAQWLESMGVDVSASDRIGESYGEAMHNLRLRYIEQSVDTVNGYPSRKAVVCTTESYVYQRPAFDDEDRPIPLVALGMPTAEDARTKFRTETLEHAQEARTRRTLLAATSVPGRTAPPCSSTTWAAPCSWSVPRPRCTSASAIATSRPPARSRSTATRQDRPSCTAATAGPCGRNASGSTWRFRLPRWPRSGPPRASPSTRRLRPPSRSTTSTASPCARSPRH